MHICNTRPQCLNNVGSGVVWVRGLFSLCLHHSEQKCAHMVHCRICDRCIVGLLNFLSSHCSNMSSRNSHHFSKAIDSPYGCAKRLWKSLIGSCLLKDEWIRKEWLMVLFLHRMVNSLFNTLRPRRNRRHFADNIFKCIFENENERISPRISLKFVPKVGINNIPALVQIMAWRRPGDKSLSEPMMVSLLTHICVTWPQWVKCYNMGYGTGALWDLCDGSHSSPLRPVIQIQFSLDCVTFMDIFQNHTLSVAPI